MWVIATLELLETFTDSWTGKAMDSFENGKPKIGNNKCEYSKTE